MHRTLCSETKQKVAAKWQNFKQEFSWSPSTEEIKIRVLGLQEKRSHEKHLRLYTENPEKLFLLTKCSLEIALTSSRYTDLTQFDY